MSNQHLLVEPINHAAALARLQHLAKAVKENVVSIEELSQPKTTNSFEYDVIPL